MVDIYLLVTSITGYLVYTRVVVSFIMVLAGPDTMLCTGIYMSVNDLCAWWLCLLVGCLLSYHECAHS